MEYMGYTVLKLEYHALKVLNSTVTVRHYQQPVTFK